MSSKQVSVQQKAPSEEERLQKIAQRNELIFSGTVISVGPPPKQWSGYAVAYQTVRYKIEKVFKGNFGAPEISVDHVVVHGSKTAQPGETPGLSIKIFAPGSKLIVFAQQTENRGWKDLSEDLGALPYSDESAGKVQTAIH